MNPLHRPLSPFGIVALAFAALAAPAAAAASRPIDEHRPADPQGEIEVSNVAGRVEVIGWDKAELAVSGTLGDGVERVEIASSGTRSTVRVVTKRVGGMSFDFSGDAAQAKLVLHVPQRGSLSASLVSADLHVSGLQGDQQLQTVSGDIVTTVQHEARVHTVSGDVHLAGGAGAARLDLATVSGDLEVDGGGGDVSITTVSGDAHLKLGRVNRAHLKTVSGDLRVSSELAADGRFEAETVSGDAQLTFTGPLPPAEYDLQSFSGDITTCIGRKAASEGYGPGTRLNFREGAATARVRVDSKSGDISLCAGK